MFKCDVCKCKSCDKYSKGCTYCLFCTIETDKETIESKCDDFIEIKN